MAAAQEKSIEVTAEEAAAMATRARAYSSGGDVKVNTSSSSGGKGVKKTFSKLMKPMVGSKKPPKLNRSASLTNLSSSRGDFSLRNSAVDVDNSSLNSESIGQLSVGASVDTVQISNKHTQNISEGNQNSSSSSKGKKTPWKKIKHFMGLPATSGKRGGSNKVADEPVFFSGTTATVTSATLSHDAVSLDLTATESVSSYSGGVGDTGARRRTASMDLPVQHKRQGQTISLQQHQAMLDDAVRGRLDGLDLLCLGPANLISLERHYAVATDTPESSSSPWEAAPAYSFAGRSTQYNTRQMVMGMMWSSDGQDTPEVVLEGFFRDDRWIVKLDVPRHRGYLESSFRSSSSSVEVTAAGAGAHSNSSRSANRVIIDVDSLHSVRMSQSPEHLPLLQLTDEEDHSSHSTTDAAEEFIPREKLWRTIWGTEKTPPKPPHMSSMEAEDGNSDSILEMAASCNVPIDLDEDTFMIGNSLHLQSVHDFASVPLQHGQFDEAMEIFKRILKGIEIQEDDALRHLEGVTLHNMSVIAMWQENFEEALDLAGKAVKARIQYLPEGHPDTAVSLVRQGYAYFALEQFDLAQASFQAALDGISEDSVAKAKVLSNLGVVQYQRGEDGEALKNFTDALEIQLLWLQGPVRRQTTVFEASVMLSNMGKIHIKRGDYDLAVSVYEEALLLLTSIFRSDHDVVVANLVSLAMAHAFDANPKKACQILNGVLRSQLGRMGPEALEVIETTGAIGNLHFGLGNYEDALKCFVPVLKWQKANLHPSHPALKKTKDFMKSIKKSIQAVWV